MPYRERDIQIKFFVTEEEKEFIKKKMALIKTENMSAYLRKMAIDGYLLHVDYGAFDDMCALMGRISGNVNQIAKRVNLSNRIYDEDISEIKEKQEELWRLLKSVLSKLP